MSPDDRTAFAAALSVVYSLYRIELSEGVMAVWWAALRQYELSEIRVALTRHTMNPDSGQFLPKPADVVKELGGTTNDASIIAWHKAIEGIRNHGTYNSVVFDDPVINRVIVDMGGWTWLGRQTEKEMPFVEKRFRDAYRAWARRGFLGTTPVLRLPGVIEATNAAGGFLGHLPTPVLIGDPAKALKISQGATEGQPALELGVKPS